MSHKAQNYEIVELGEVLKYEQPTKYIVNSTNYDSKSATPVLTAGKSFILGHTDEKSGIFPQEKLPVIIFDDFTTAIKFVDFPFKVKSSAMKILHADRNKADTRFLFYTIQQIIFPVRRHKRHWISEYSKIKIQLPSLVDQKRIADKLDKVFVEIEKGQNKVLEVDNQTVMFSKSLLRKTFSNPDWQRVKLKDVCNVFAGSSAPQSKTYFSSDGVLFARVSDLATKQNRLLNSTRDKINPKEINNLRLVKAKAGTTVFPKSGAAILTNSRALLGVDMYIVGHLAALSPKENIDPVYIYFFMLGVDMKQYIPNVSYPSLNLKVIKEIKISIPFKNGKPDFAEQKHVAGELDKAFALSEQLHTLFGRQEKSFISLRASVLSDVLKPEAQAVLVATPVLSTTPRIFDIQQAVAHILKRLERGEMVVAKILYFAQKIYQVPLGIQFSAQNFGPYDSAVKKAVTAGLSIRNKFFTKKGSGGMQVLSLGSNANKILKYSNSALARKINHYLDEMMPYFSASDSNSIERLATICKIIEDTKTTDKKVIQEKLHKWKPNKFQDAEVSRTIAFIKKHNWDAQLIK